MQFNPQLVQVLEQVVTSLNFVADHFDLVVAIICTSSLWLIMLVFYADTSVYFSS